MLYLRLYFSLEYCIFVSEDQGYNDKQTAAYNRLKTGTAETDDHLSLSHKLQRRYAR